MDAVVTTLAERIRAAAAGRTQLRICGGGTKEFYGNACVGEPLDTRNLRGIVSYEPSELVVTARAGTPLSELESLLAAHGQMLAFEPPHFGEDATVGGCIAAGLAGPRRASAGVTYGSVRDYVLGAKLLDGRGRLLSFGGTVMKNVAGYDLARAITGSLGVLGVITEVSLKVLPVQGAETTLQIAATERDALWLLNDCAGRPLPISASTWCDDMIMLRLSGASSAIEAARGLLPARDVEVGSYWSNVREHRIAFFEGDTPLWRLSVPSVAPPLELEGRQLIEWGGALRWLRSSLPAATVRARAVSLGGHATLFRGGDRSAGAFTPLASAVAAIHVRLKAEFDPAGIFNRGRMYPEF